MKKFFSYVAVVIIIFVLVAAYFNIGYATANVVLRVCQQNDVAKTAIEKFVTFNGKLYADATNGCVNINFIAHDALWPLSAVIIPAIVWTGYYIWHYIFTGGIVKLLGLV